MEWIKSECTDESGFVSGSSKRGERLTRGDPLGEVRVIGIVIVLTIRTLDYEDSSGLVLFLL